MENIIPTAEAVSLDEVKGLGSFVEIEAPGVRDTTIRKSSSVRSRRKLGGGRADPFFVSGNAPVYPVINSILG